MKLSVFNIDNLPIGEYRVTGPGMVSHTIKTVEAAAIGHTVFYHENVYTPQAYMEMYGVGMTEMIPN